MRNKIVVMYDENPDNVLFWTGIMFFALYWTALLVGIPLILSVWFVVIQVIVVALQVYEGRTNNRTISSSIINVIR